MSDQKLTPAAERVLSDVQSRWESNPRVQIDSTLFLALQADEGRAAEILLRWKISTGTLPTVEADQDTSSDFPEWRRALLRRADQIAIQLSLEGLTGTEHLLLALVEQHAPLAAQLAERGLTLQQLEEEVTVHDAELDIPEIVEIQIRSAEVGAMEQSALERILDASANRCREGLRVVEDYVRFQLDDNKLSSELKEIRHRLTQVLIHLGQPNWVRHRDTVHDVGTRSHLASERFRGSLADVLRANLKRVEESLRSLEEYSKLIDSDLSSRIEQCRYRFYTVEQAIEATLLGRRRLQDCRLYLLATDRLCRYGSETVIRETVTAGVDVVQLREKDLTDRQLIDRGLRIREWTQSAGALFIVNDRPDIAVAVHADGVHLGQDDLTVQEARKIVGGNRLIGISTHSPDQARQAVMDGADYLGVGPVFPTTTKEFTSLAGLEYVRSVAGQISIPWFPIGGITLDNLPELLAAGATRVAVTSAICGAAHPRGITREFAERLAAAAASSNNSGK